MSLTRDGLNCSQCFTNARRLKSFTPECIYSVCRNASFQYKEVEDFYSFWQFVRASETIPKEVILKDVPLSETDLELCALLDSEVSNHQHQERERQRAQSQAQRGVSSKGGSFGRAR